MRLRTHYPTNERIMTKYLSGGSLIYIFAFLLSPIYTYLMAIGAAPKLYLSSFFILVLLTTVVSEKGKLVLKSFSSKQNKSTGIAIAIFFAYTLLTQLFHLAGGDIYDMGKQSLFLFNFRNSFYNLLWLICGIYIGKLIILRNENSEQIAFVIWLFISIFYLLNVSADSLKIDLSNTELEDKVVYLTLSDAYALSSIIVIGTSKSFLRSMIVLASSAFMLLILQSRTSLVFTFFSVVAGYTLYSSFNRKVIFAIIITTCSILLAPFVTEILSTDERMAILVTNDYSSDWSYIGRATQFKFGFEHIQANPIFGGYEKVVKDLGATGAYMHNILSFWQYYGVFGFAMALYLFIVFPIRTLLKLDLSKTTKTTLAMLAIYIIMQVLFSRAYVYMYSWLVLGFFLLARIAQKPRSKTKDSPLHIHREEPGFNSQKL
jgi:O-antigen ligase